MFSAEPIADSRPSDDHSSSSRPIRPRVEAGPRRSLTTWTMSSTDWPGERLRELADQEARLVLLPDELEREQHQEQQRHERQQRVVGDHRGQVRAAVGEEVDEPRQVRGAAGAEGRRPSHERGPLVLVIRRTIGSASAVVASRRRRARRSDGPRRGTHGPQADLDPGGTSGRRAQRRHARGVDARATPRRPNGSRRGAADLWEAADGRAVDARPPAARRSSRSRRPAAACSRSATTRAWSAP